MATEIHAGSGRSSPWRALPHPEAAALIDTDGGIHYTLSIAYRGTGQTERAQDALARYRELSAAAEEASAGWEVSPPWSKLGGGS